MVMEDYHPITWQAEAEDHCEFKASVDYMARPYLKKKFLGAVLVH